MIDPRIDIALGEALIDMLVPAFAPLLEQIGPVPVALFGAEAVFADTSGGEHRMRVRPRFAITA
jgi:hypothetical protein